MHFFMLSRSLLLILADDDSDDCLLFQEALNDLRLQVRLETMPDGVRLMDHLRSTGHLPDVLYLDLNMPCKGGLECLAEIKIHPALRKIPVIVYSTSYRAETVDQLYNNGAQYYIRKPSEFKDLRDIILKSLTMLFQNPMMKPERDQFVLEAS